MSCCSVVGTCASNPGYCSDAADGKPLKVADAKKRALPDLLAIRHAHALPTVDAKGNVADLDERRAGRHGDGVLVHHPPHATVVLAFAHVQAEVADVDPDPLAADAQTLLEAALHLPRPDATIAAAVLVGARFLGFATAHDEVGLILAPHAVALEEVPRQRAPRRVVLEDDVGEW
jgi:hypothetical protein